MKYLFLLCPVLSFLWAQTSVNPNSLFTTSGHHQELVEMIYKKCGNKAPLPKEVTDGSPKMAEFNTCVKKELDDNKEKVARLKRKVRQGSEDIPILKQPPRTQELLTQYLQNRFDKKVRGKDGHKRIVNHADYFRLYQSQLSQMVALTLNSYCMNANTEDFRNFWKKAPPSRNGPNLSEYLENEFGNRPFILLPKEQRSKAFNQNKKLLQDPTVGEVFIKICAVGITKVCHGDDEESKKIDKESKQEACQTLGALRKLNRAITNNEKRLKAISSPHGKDQSQWSGFALEKFPDSSTGKVIELYNPLIQGRKY